VPELTDLPSVAPLLMAEVNVSDQRAAFAAGDRVALAYEAGAFGALREIHVRAFREIAMPRNDCMVTGRANKHHSESVGCRRELPTLLLCCLPLLDITAD
jgi:hypothetical protein